MEELIVTLLMAFSVGMLWGIVISGTITKLQISRGKLPRFLKSKKSELLVLLKEVKEV